MRILISKLFTGEKFRLLNDKENPVGQSYKITEKSDSCCYTPNMVHLSVESEPNWAWCIHRDTKVFLLIN